MAATQADRSSDTMALMPKMKATNVRFSAAKLRALEQLAKKLHISKSDVIRLAVAKLAEAEGIGTAFRG